MSIIQKFIASTALRNAVEDALHNVFHSSRVIDMVLLAGGLSGSSVYKIMVGETPYLLKLSPKEENTTSSCSPLDLAASAGIAPRLYYNDRLQGIVISDYIDAKPIRSVFTPKDLISKLALTIKAIHTIQPHGKQNNLFETVDGLIDQFQKNEMLSGPIFDECFEYYRLISDKYPRNEADIVFSHNDLNPNNILCDGEKIWIVDWDAAYLNNRYVDLANAANFFVHTEEEEKIFMNIYFDDPADDYKMACFYVMRQICRVVYAMLMFQLARQTKSADYLHNQEMEGINIKTFGDLMGAGKLTLAAYEGQLMYGKALLNDAVYHMRTPRFKASLSKFE